MNKKILAVAFALVMAVVLSGAVAAADNSASTTNQSVSTVQAATNTTLPDPTNTRTGIHYTTIQAAIDSVFTQNGDTITVEAGTYNEDVLVWKSLHLIGAGTVNTFVNSFFVNTAGSGSEITGFTVTGGTGEAITLQDSDNNNIHGNVISGGYSAGVAAVNSDDNEIHNNIIDNSLGANYYGIYLDNSTGNEIYGNIIANSIFSGIWLLNSDGNSIGDPANIITGNGRDGILLQSSDNNTIEINTISGNADDGIELSLSNGNTITNNTLSNNPNGIVLDQSNNNKLGIEGSNTSFNSITGPGASTSNTHGIMITDSSGNIINAGIGLLGDNTKGFHFGIYLDNATNTIVDYVGVYNCDTGIYLVNGSSATMTDAWVKNSLENGIWVESSTVVLQTGTHGGTQLTGNGFDGLLAENSSVNVDDALIDNNGIWGIHLISCDDAVINDSTITNNTDDGVYIEDSDDVEITDCNISDNGGNGISLDTCNNCLIDPCTITGNADDGIFAETSDNLQIEDNTISSNGADGINLNTCDAFDIDNNIIENNNHNGIEVVNSTGGEIDEQNIIDNNGIPGYDGIHLTSSSEIIIRDNQIFSNGDDGVSIGDSNKVTVFQNNIYDNHYGVYIHGTSNDVNVNFNRIVDNSVWDLLYTGTGDVDATLNWWGYNGASDVAAQIDDAGTGDLTYNPWIMLSITASPTTVSIGGTSTITADLQHDSNGVYHNPTFGVVPYDGSANFATNKGSFINVTGFSNGMATATLTGLSTSGVATVSTTVDHQTKSTTVTVNPTATIAQIIAASATVKTYYETHSSTLPPTVNVGATTVTMPQFLYLLVTATRNINVSNLNPINIIPVNPAPAPSGNNVPGSLVKSSYLSVAQNIQNFIITNGRAPNYAQTSLGRISFSKLVYTYAKVINFYGNIIVPARLPNYVTVA